MSAKKVRRHIRQLQRQRRREQREAVRAQRRQASQEEAARRRQEHARPAEEHQAAEPQDVVADEQLGDDAVFDEPAVGSAVGSAEEPVEEPTAEEPETPEAEQPEGEEPEGDQPDPERVDADRSATGQPDAEQSDTSQSDAERPDTGQSASDQPDTEQPDSEQPAPEQPEPADPEGAEPARTPLIAPGLRAGAVAAALGVLAVAGGSLAMDVSGHVAQPRAVAPVDTAAVVSDTALVCPPMPGLPDSVSTEGLLDYRSRDDSAAAQARGVVLSPREAEGSSSDEADADIGAELGLLGQDGYEQDQELDTAALSPGMTENPQDDSPSWRHDSAALTDETEAPLLRLNTQDAAATLAGAAQYLYTADSGPVAGTAAAECRPPQRSHWFFGPEIGEGGTGLLTLANPSNRQATVEVTAYDSDGARSGSGVRTQVVPAQSTRTVNIASIAGDDPVNGVQVNASQAPVSASLQSSRASDGTGIGVEFLPSSSSDAERHVLAGIPVAADSQEDSAAFPTELWIRSASTGQSTVEVQVYSDEGPVPLENASVFSVQGGDVDSIDLSGLEAGTYDLIVTTEGPSDVAVKSYGTEPGEQDRLDFAWLAGATPLRDGYGVVLPDPDGVDPDSVEAQLRLFAPEAGTQVTYRVLGADGETSAPQSVEVPTGGAATVEAEQFAVDEVDEPVAVVFEEPATEVVGSLRLTGEDDTFSMLPVRAVDDPAGSVPVRLGD
ncbi:DUF5719 family protein [Nesterenkonia aerolata]|uniref:DUF5719 family protein n=1 Tax=Nesterenkonia aerolata TaxID=3074079 RepID=A0ABU2DR86_9MICC|nr:DUF5719 family protein [Nesterenkonia sp. LY-0111]MDR8018885.1 DUF5719 family protein [Nesterenkonia sp. LY-0111]